MLREDSMRILLTTVLLVAPVLTARAQDRPEGLFQRYIVNFSSGNRLEARTLHFLPDGRISRAMPTGGSDTVHFARCNPDMCGRYTVTAERLNVGWNSGSSVSWTFRRTDDALEVDGDLYRPARGLIVQTLAGTWVGAQSTGSAFENTYVFGADSTFTLGSGSARTSGRFAADGTTLRLTFSDGTRADRTIFGLGSASPPTMLAIDGDVYRRR